MKRKIRFLTLMLTVALSLGLFAACAGNKELELSVNQATVGVYDDYQIMLPNGEKDVTWESSDTTIATVSDGLVSFQGKIGETTITAVSGSKKGTCVFTAIDMGLPVVKAQDQTAFVNAATDIDLKIQYNENSYTGYTVSKVEIEDETIAIYESGKIKGLKEGETAITVTLSWKGLSVKNREPVKLTVYPEYSLLAENKLEVFSVESSSVKPRTRTITPEFFVRGVKRENASFVLAVKSGSEFVAVEGMNVSAKDVTEPQQAVLELEARDGEDNASLEIQVSVQPNYDVKEFNELQTGMNAEYSLFEESVGGREGVYRYYTGEDCGNIGNDWIKWGNHLEFSSLKTQNNQSRYESIVKEEGVVLVSVDLWYAGQQTGETWEYRGLSIGSQYGRNSADRNYYVDNVKNYGERLIVNNGKVTNCLVPNTWLTVYFDLREFTVGDLIDITISSNRVRDTTYLDNIRFWYDDCAIKDLDKSEVDLEPRALEQNPDYESEYIAQDNEFMTYAPAWTSFEKSAEESFYTYLMKDRTYENGKNITAESLLRRIYPVNIFNGTAANKGFQYMAFDYMYRSGSPTLVLYDAVAQQNISYRLTGTLQEENVLIYRDGEKLTSIPTGEWVTLLVRLHNNVSSSDTLYLTAASAETEFCLRNTRYYSDNSCLYEIGYNNLFEIEVERFDYAIVGEEKNLRDLIFATYRGNATDEYEIKNVWIGNTEIISVSDGVLMPRAKGETSGGFTVEYVSGSYRETFDIEFDVVVYESDTILLSSESLAIYGGSDTRFNDKRSAEISVTQFFVDGLPHDMSALSVCVEEGESHIELNGFTVNGVSPGSAKVKVFYNKDDGSEVCAYVDITVHDGAEADTLSFAVTTAGAGTATYTDVEESVGGRENVKMFRLANGDQWHNGNKLIFNASNHLGGAFTVSTAAENMKTNHYNYVAVDFYLPENQSFYIYAPDSEGAAHVGDKLTAGQPFNPTKLGANLLLFNEAGVRLSSGDMIQANRWYTVAVKYVYTNASWSCVLLNPGAKDCEIYLDKARECYTEASIAGNNAAILDGNYYVQDEKLIVPFAFFLGGQEQADAIFSFVFSGDSAEVQTNGSNLVFSQGGQYSVTASAQCGSVEISKTFVLNIVLQTQTASEAWASQNVTLTDGAFDMSANVWNDYVYCAETGKGTGNVTNMRENGYRNLRFQVTVDSGNLRIYVPTEAGQQGYVRIGATFSYGAGDAAPSGYISVYDAQGTELEVGSATSYGETYTVLIRYNVNTTGWAEVCMKGEAASGTLGAITFYDAVIS